MTNYNHPLSNLQIYTIDRKTDELVLIDRFTGEVIPIPLSAGAYCLLEYLDVYNPKRQDP